MVSLTPLVAQSAEQHSEFDNIWQKANLYRNAQGDYLKLSGRLQADAAWFDASQGDYEDLLWRRFRFGFDGKYRSASMRLEADIDLNEGLSDSYNRITDAKISWQLNPKIQLTLLKQSVGFTLDGNISSTKLYTPQRNNVTNNLWFTSEYFTGASIKGKLENNWNYRAGVFSSDGSDEISISDASYFTLLSIGRKYGPSKFWQEAEFNADFVYNDTDIDANTRDFSHVTSLSGKFKYDQWSLATDLAMGNGHLGQSDIWGLVIMPMYSSSKRIHWVMRYTYLDSENANGLRLGRYESSVVDGRGDRYHELFGGVNFLLYSHKLKFQVGLQYTDVNDEANDGGEYDGWGLTASFRSYW